MKSGVSLAHKIHGIRLSGPFRAHAGTNRHSVMSHSQEFPCPDFSDLAICAE